ncbi:MAG: hypothetical protein ABSC50_07640 [Candidatus Bathyarchaeia archaeon]
MPIRLRSKAAKTAVVTIIRTSTPTIVGAVSEKMFPCPEEANGERDCWVNMRTGTRNPPTRRPVDAPAAAPVRICLAFNYFTPEKEHLRSSNGRANPPEPAVGVTGQTVAIPDVADKVVACSKRVIPTAS